MMKAAARCLLIDARYSSRAGMSWAHDSAALSASPMGAGAIRQMETSQYICEGPPFLSSANAALHITVPWVGCVSASAAYDGLAGVHTNASHCLLDGGPDGGGHGD